VKVNRRSFFGVAAAAPVAAKQAVTSVLEYEKSAGVNHIKSSYYGSAKSVAGLLGDRDNSPPTDFLRHELKEVLSQRKMTAENGPDLSYERDLAAYIQIDNRRATSPAIRSMLISEEKAKRAKARELSYLDRRIADLKEKLGPLAMIFEGGE